MSEQSEVEQGMGVPVDAEMGKLLAYGHAAYCAGWKAAFRALSGSLHGDHSRAWIESNPPTGFTEPLKWRDETYAVTNAPPTQTKGSNRDE